MRKIATVVVSLLVGVLVQAQVVSPGYHLEGTVGLSVPVSGLKMTNLVFPVAVWPAVKVSRDVLMQRPKGIENVIELKAMRRNFPETNISVYGRDGRLYSFVLHYVEDTAVLNFRVVVDGASILPAGVSAGLGAVGGVVAGSSATPGSVGGIAGLSDRAVIFTGLPVDGVTLDSDAVMLARRRGLIGRSVVVSGLRLWLKGVYLRDSLLWICLGMYNRTPIGFAPAYLRVYVEDKKRIKRTASQQVTVVPVYPPRLAAVRGNSGASLALGLTPFVPARGKRLVVEMADSSGGRVLVLRVKGKKVLVAKVVER